MFLISTSTRDIASMNILHHLLKLRRWKECGNFGGHEVYENGDFLIVTIDEEHLFYDNIDAKVKENIHKEVDAVIYASRHKSAANLRTLSVHPIGNYSQAEYGGLSYELVLTAPHLMTQALRFLKENSKELEYNVCFEATHHGPFLKTPTFFIEIGSDESAWNDEKAADVIAKTILSLSIEKADHPVAIGVGGGHYAPRMTDVALRNKISFGHIIPTYALDNINEDMIQKAIDRTPQAKIVYFHRKAMKKAQYHKFKELFESKGLKAVREKDLSKLSKGD